MKDKGKCEVENLVGHWIKIVSRNLINLINQKLDKYGFTLSQVSVLSQLWGKDGLTQKEIAEKLKIKPPSITGLVDTLGNKGWVIRKEDEEDARIKRIYLTKEGSDLRYKSLEVLKEAEEILCKGFLEEEKALMLIWLKKMYKNIQ